MILNYQYIISSDNYMQDYNKAMIALKQSIMMYRAMITLSISYYVYLQNKLTYRYIHNMF